MFPIAQEIRFHSSRGATITARVSSENGSINCYSTAINFPLCNHNKIEKYGFESSGVMHRSLDDAFLEVLQVVLNYFNLIEDELHKISNYGRVELIAPDHQLRILSDSGINNSIFIA